MSENEEVCRDCDGNGSTNPPLWTVKCKKCDGKGLIKEISEEVKNEEEI